MDHRRIETLERRWSPERHAYLVGMTGRSPEPSEFEDGCASVSGARCLAVSMAVLFSVLLVLTSSTFR